MARAMESSKPVDVRVCYDPYARAFVGGWLWFLGQATVGIAKRRSPGVLEYLAVRTRHIDDYLQARLADGIAQLVILGAGFDARAYRFEQLKACVQVLEVDHPATQRVKIGKLGKIFGQVADHVTFVPIDFESETLDKLFACGYSKRLKTLFIWEGVVMYLDRASVDATLAWVTQNSGAGSSIVFDYMYVQVLDGTLKRNEFKSMQRWRGVTGEGLVFGIEKGRVEEFLTARGFGNVVNADSDALDGMYLTGVNAGRHVAPTYALVHATINRK